MTVGLLRKSLSLFADDAPVVLCYGDHEYREVSMFGSVTIEVAEDGKYYEFYSKEDLAETSRIVNGVLLG